MQKLPLNAILAIVASLTPWPAMKTLDYFNRGCGDGLCSMFSGMLILGALAVATIVFMVRSARRSETPGVLRILPPLLWVAELVPLTL